MKTLSSIRVNDMTYSLMQQAISKHNKKSLVKLKLNEFRRLSYEFLSKMILLDKEIPIKLE